MKNYDEAGVSKHLLKLRKVTNIDSVRKVITINPDSPIGNHCWGKIDFLEHHCGYVIVRERPGKKIVVDSEEKKEKKEKAPLKKMRNNNVERNNNKSNDKNKVQSHPAKAYKAKAKK